MLELSRLRTGHQASLACPGYARVVGNRYTSDLVAGVNMICIGINIERSAGAGFGEVVGEDGNGGTESRRRRSARGWWTMRQPAGGAKLSEEAKRASRKLPCCCPFVAEEAVHQGPAVERAERAPGHRRA